MSSITSRHPRRAVLELATAVGADAPRAGRPTARSEPSPPVACPAAESGYAPVDGLRLSYEVHGSGKPLLLVHGGRVATDPAYGALLPALARIRRVIAVEAAGRGQVAQPARPDGYESTADDVAALAERLGIGSADVVGYCFGGGVALGLAVRHPKAVRRLVVASALVAWRAEDVARPPALDGCPGIAVPLHLVDGTVGSGGDAWASMAAPLRPLPVRDAEWATALSSISAPVLLLDGDLDGVRPADALELLRVLDGDATCQREEAPSSRWAVLPATAHSAATFRADLVPHVLASFLDAPLPIAA